MKRCLNVIREANNDLFNNSTNKKKQDLVDIEFYEGEDGGSHNSDEDNDVQVICKGKTKSHGKKKLSAQKNQHH